MIGKGATPSFFAIANDNYTLTIEKGLWLRFQLQSYNSIFRIGSLQSANYLLSPTSS